jgi:hypothetical protein
MLIFFGLQRIISVFYFYKLNFKTISKKLKKPTNNSQEFSLQTKWFSKLS